MQFLKNLYNIVSKTILKEEKVYKNKEDYQAYQEEWRKNHPDYFKKYYQNNAFGMIRIEFIKGGK